MTWGINLDVNLAPAPNDATTTVRVDGRVGGYGPIQKRGLSQAMNTLQASVIAASSPSRIARDPVKVTLTLERALRQRVAQSGGNLHLETSEIFEAFGLPPTRPARNAIETLLAAEGVAVRATTR